MEQWKIDIIDQKINKLEKQLYSLEVDMRVAVRFGLEREQAQIKELARVGEEQLAFLKELRDGN